MEKGINVLSLFDGMSCGMIALERSGIKVNNYFASEIDKYAIQVSKHNYPNIIQLGDVTNWRGWDLPKIDLIIGGSPCQGFSFAGKGLKFEDPRSKLFFEMVDIIEHFKPKYFLLENVKMKKESENVITKYMGVEPIKINSSLLSAQNRERIYWTNIPKVSQPKDKGVLISDIVQDSSNLMTMQEIKDIFESDNALFLNNIQSYNKRVCGVSLVKSGIRPHQGDKRKSGISELGTLHAVDVKSYSVIASHSPKLLKKDLSYRNMSILECERLQTVPEGYTSCVSDTQRYKMLGNGWTVDVIAHIFEGLKNKFNY